jgi:Uma2 family endonuclease
MTDVRSQTASIDLLTMSEAEVAGLAERLGGRPVPGVHWSEEQFVDWAFGRFKAEWVDGNVVLMPPVSDAHDSLDEWLGRLIGEFVERRGIGVIRRNMFVRLPRRRRRRVPDILFIAKANLARIRPTLINGPPDLAIEIISRDSQNRDRRDKYLEYEASGVREYWLIDPLSKTLDVYVLNGHKYRPMRPKDERFDSVVLPGFYLRLEWLFSPQRPKVVDVLAELGL